MSFHARTLDSILSATPPSAHPQDLETLLFTMSTVIMTPEQLQQVQKTRNILGSGPILQLPTELLWRIFELLARKDKGNFRMPNKLLRAATKLPFAKTQPSTWRFEMTEKSLKGLVNLTADQDLVARCEHITFCMNRLVEISKDTLNTRELAHNERVTQHLNFLLRGHHIKAIAKALDNLRANKKPTIALGVYDGWWCLAETDTAFAADEFLDCSLQCATFKKWDMRDTLLVLDSVIRRARFNPQTRLELLNIPMISSKDMFWKQLVESPDLVFSCVDGSTSRISSGRHRLELRYVGIGESERCRLFGVSLPAHTDLYRYLKDRQYKEISLNCLFTSWQNLTGFVEGDNLTKLELIGVCLFGGAYESWPLKFYQWLRSMPGLESLELERVSNSHGQPLFEERIRWQSREEIHAGLDALISNINA